MRRVQASGALRADFVATDLRPLHVMVSSSALITPPHAPRFWRRYLALALDGLRTPDPHPLPQPGLTRRVCLLVEGWSAAAAPGSEVAVVVGDRRQPARGLGDCAG